MKKPPTPPDWMKILAGPDHADFFSKIVRPEVQEFIRSANDGYVHWHKLRFYELPAGLTKEQAWAAVQMSRMGQRRTLPLWSYSQSSLLTYWVPPQHMAWLHAIDQKAGGTITSRNAIPDDGERYLFSSLMEEAIASSQLEGASTTRARAKKMLRARRKPRDRSEQMIMNNYSAICEIRDFKSAQLTPELIMHLQTMLAQGTTDDPNIAGRYRTDADQVRVEDTTTGEVLHVPPPAETIEARIEQLCAFANSTTKPFIHPVIKAIVLHFTLGFIHPFVDGNGRTARALFYWYMLRHGFWLAEYLSISRILLSAPWKYARAYLYSESDQGDLTYFIHYNLQVICRAINAFHAYLDAKASELKEATQLLAESPDLNHRQEAAIGVVLRHPGRTFTIRQHAGTYNVTYATARSDLLGLEKANFLISVKQGKRLVFHPNRDILNSLRRKVGPLPKQPTVPVPRKPVVKTAHKATADDLRQLPLFK